MNFKVEVLRNNVPYGKLLSTGGRIDYRYKSLIKRSATLNVSGFEKLPLPFNRMKDRIRILAFDGDLEYSLGTFMIASMPLTITDTDSEYNVQLFDESYIINQSVLDERLFIVHGTNYIDAITSILVSLGFTDVVSEPTNLILNVDREFAVGDNVLEIINTLLSEIGYENIYFDEYSVIRLTKKRNVYTPKHIYRDNKDSIIAPNVVNNFDIYNLPNVFVGVLSNAEQECLVYKKENHETNSEISIENRGYKVTKVYKLPNIASYDELVDYVEEEFIKSLQATDKVSIQTTNEYNHVDGEIVQVECGEISGLYKEVSWSIELDDMSFMRHELERKTFV